MGHSMLDNGKINKTAFTSLLGAVEDPKIIENIGECDAIGNIAWNLGAIFLQTSNSSRKKLIQESIL